MERNIIVFVKDKVAYAPKDAVIVCNNSDYTITFDFDDEWAGIDKKTARFVANGKRTDVVFTGNVANVPPVYNAAYVKVGVFAPDIATTYASIRCDKSILCEGGAVADPPPDVYNQIIDLLNQIKENEVSDEEIEAAVTKYLTENPVEAGATEEQVQQINANTEALDGKVDINQGVMYEDHILQVGPDGKLHLVWPDSTVAYYIPEIDSNGNLKWVPSRDDMIHFDTLYPLYGKDGDNGKDGTGISTITIEEV